MDVTFRRGDPAGRTSGALIVAIPQGTPKLEGSAAAIDRATRGALSALLKTRDFGARPNETAVLYPSGVRAARLVVVGLGTPVELTEHRLRLAIAQAVKRARDLKAKTVTVAVPAIGASIALDRAAQAIAEGAVLGPYRFSAYRSEAAAPALQRVEIVERDAAKAKVIEPAVVRGARWAEAVCLARDLANTPGQDLTPERLAARAQEIGQASGARVEVLGVPQLERIGAGALLAVGRGSEHPPRLIVLERPARGGAAPVTKRGKKRSTAEDTVVVIGKGVTFDTGGISLKPAPDMGRMKYDMSGAAAVLGLFAALPTIDPPFRVVGIIPSAENMPGGRALKPGDVVRALDGTTIEVTNTDAEGRLLLADALGFAKRYSPAAVVDLATLTGAISIALGHLAAGLFTDDDALAESLRAAGETAGERLWRMPVWDDYAPGLASDTADLVNSAGREGGAILGAVFLKRFARGLRWAHLDIASTAWAPVERPHEGRGPTGYGVRLLLEWLSRRASAAGAVSAAAPPASPRRAPARRAGRRPAPRA